MVVLDYAIGLSNTYYAPWDILEDFSFIMAIKWISILEKHSVYFLQARDLDGKWDGVAEAEAE